MEVFTHGGNESTDGSSSYRRGQANIINIGRVRSKGIAKNPGNVGYDSNVLRIHIFGDYCDHCRIRGTSGSNVFTYRVRGVLRSLYRSYSATWSHVSPRGITLQLDASCHWRTSELLCRFLRLVSRHFNLHPVSSGSQLDMLPLPILVTGASTELIPTILCCSVL